MKDPTALAPLQTSKSERPLLVFDTHPIQYRSPVFRRLVEMEPSLKVFFFNDAFDGRKWWFHEVGKIPKQDFAVPLKEGFPNETLGLEGLGLGAKARRIAQVLRQERPRAVLTYGYYLPEHWILRWVTARLGIPLIFVGETFAMGGPPLRRLLKAPLLRYFFRGVSQFIAIGERTRAHYQALGIEGARIVTAKYCTDVSFFELAAETSRKLRREWRKAQGIPEDAFVLLFVGRLFERKRPLDIVKLHELLQGETRVHTLLVGNGPMEEELRKQTESLSRFHVTGFRNQDELRAIYHGSDLLVVPSEYETWGLVVNEAFAAGTPALVTDTCGVAGDLVVPGQTGFVFPVGNLPEAVGHVRKVLEDPELRWRLGDEARRKVREEYSVGQFATAMKLALERAE